MTLSEDFMISICETALQRKIIEVLNNKDMKESEKTEVLIRFIRELGSND